MAGTHMALAGTAENGGYEANCSCGWEITVDDLGHAADLAALHMLAS